MKKLLLILLCLPMIGFGQNVNIPDANFKAYLVGNSAINTNGDSEIQVSEATVFNGYIDCGYDSIADLTGIESFTVLTALYCYYNQLTSLDISNNTYLFDLRCSNNQLTSLDVSQNPALTEFHCSWNLLTSLDVSNNTALVGFSCSNNQLTSLDVSDFSDLRYLDCSGNQITSLDVSVCSDLFHLDCSGNQITSLDVSNNTVLDYLGCGHNLLECLDVSQNTALYGLECNDNLLEQLNTKNGNWENLFTGSSLGFGSDATNNNLTCVEVDNIGYANNNNWISFFDSFVTFSTNCNYTNPCATVSAIKEHTTNKQLLKVTEILGRETKQTNQPLFYIYDDGTVEKRIVIE